MASEKKYLIHVFTENAGGGHYATLRAIEAVVAQQKRPWDIQVMDIGQLYVQLLGADPNQNYNQMLQTGSTWLHPVSMFLDKALFKLLYFPGLQLGKKYWQQQTPPDLVVSLIPLCNRMIWESLQQIYPQVPMVTIMTDFADCPPHFWMEPKTEIFLICGTAKAVQQALEIGVPKQRILSTSGLIIHPKFYEPPKVDQRTEREKLGLDPNKMTAIVSFGAYGRSSIINLMENLEQLQDKIQLILLCGSNEKLAQSLQEHPTKIRKSVQGFTNNVPYVMQLADFFIGKPGSISISEALVMNLPVIVENNFSTLLNERYNAAWILEQQVGIVISSFQHIVPAVEELLHPDNWQHYQANVIALNNQAVFEVLDLLQGMIAKDDY